MVRTQASVRWHQYWPMLQPPVVLHNGTAEQQLNGLRRELQPGVQRGDYSLLYRTNKSFQKTFIATTVLYLEVPCGGWGCSRVGGSGPGPQTILGWAGPPAQLIPTHLRD